MLWLLDSSLEKKPFLQIASFSNVSFMDFPISIAKIRN